MPVKGFSSITFKKSVLEQVQKEKERVRDTQELAPFVYSLIEEAIMQRELIRDWAPLQFIDASDNSVFLKDRIKKTLIELIVKDGDLVCTLDESPDCVHVGFAWAIPAVYRVMKDRGRKPPK